MKKVILAALSVVCFASSSYAESNIPVTFTVTASAVFGRINTNWITGWQNTYNMSPEELQSTIATLGNRPCLVAAVQTGGVELARDAARVHPLQNVSGVNVREVLVQAQGFQDLRFDGRYCFVSR